VEIRARKADYALVKEVIPDVEKEYKKNTDKESKLELDETDPQPEGS